MAQLNNAHRLHRRGVTVLPDGWELAHAPVAEEFQTATVELWSGADPEWVWDDDTQAEVRDLGDMVWAGTARIQQRNDTDLNVAGEQQVTVHRYLVTLPHDAGTGTWVQVVESGDPLLGLLRVVDTQKGSLRFERDLLCTDHLG